MNQFQTRLMYSACGVIVAGAAAWASWTTHTLIELRDIATTRPTYDDVKLMIDDHAPYRRDEGVIKRNLSEIEVKLSHIDAKLNAVHDAVLLLKNGNKVAKQ
jgi:hypothetical protein